ncbi:MAG: glycosyltransferase family 2 protein [Methanoregulaceae archaeon]|nr:glycosyltransferase family 2 protein [Methanoregulaceae archaeon]
MISIIVVNYNGKRYLTDCFAALQEQTFRDFEVILVDNASSDGSAEFVGSNFPWVILVRNQENRGYAGGVNTGIRAAGGEFILTLNNDTIPERDFVERLVRPFSQSEDVGMCASKMLLPDGRINSTGICVSRSGASWDRGREMPDDGRFDREGEVFGPCAGAALYRRKMLEQIGLFDEDFFLFMEDVDLALRARMSGWRCIYVPTARVFHYHGGTAGVGSDCAVYYGNRNIIWYPFKDYPWSFMVTSIFWIAGRTMGTIPYYIIRGKAAVILKSKIDGIMGIPGMLRKRKGIRRTLPAREIAALFHTWCNMNGN